VSLCHSQCNGDAKPRRGSQMINASSSIMPIPITSTASATGSYSSQCRLCIYMNRHPVLRFTSVRAKSRAVFLFLHFELANECSEMPRHRSRKCVVLVLEALPNCQEPNASIASGIESGLALRRMGSVTVLNYMPTNPIINAVGCLSRGGDCRHGAPPCSCRAARSHPIKRLTLELNRQGETVKSYRRSEWMVARASHTPVPLLLPFRAVLSMRKS
jgi:hypothetical protein